jgi:hypothetical protein
MKQELQHKLAQFMPMEPVSDSTELNGSEAQRHADGIVNLLTGHPDR